MLRQTKKSVARVCAILGLAFALSVYWAEIPAVIAQVDEHEGHTEHGEHGEDTHEGHAEHGEDEGHAEHGEGNEVELSAAQMEMAQIKVAALQLKRQSQRLYAPGEIISNAYRTLYVSARVPSMVLERHVILGQHVAPNDALVTLFSTDMAEAQSAFFIALSEWKRVRKLGRNTVGDKRFTKAKINAKQAQAKLSILGMAKKDIASLPERSKDDIGRYLLRASQSGTVLSDDFKQGQQVDSGQALIKLVDESVLWADASLAPELGQKILAGQKADVVVDGKTFPGVVVQDAHAIDEATRTRKVRVSLANQGHLLHPGLFADVYFNLSTEKPVLSVPESALMRSPDGHWSVFVEKAPGHFRQAEVTLVNTLNGMHVIEGVAPGSLVIIEGAFFVSSQIAKGGFDPHNH
jgi:membrane fusion protein, heavy metal efflux system